ncbi:hypothetical protein OYT88_02200 [Sporolactobacillus sp. CQH2019]|uniref:hypothetical protein n=1 Tax=Sporolactobacillus sp. CQH2019 TaxID=3023512 RepID=UPI002367C8EB|nr:hypothetical protein [Sporolactobacillus sp. CQH2019]MDD9147361.1 hypothetical protein [Sporolactobacillus sp. CQH2019]
MEQIILSEEQLQKKLSYWQNRLRLKDWDITVSIKRMSQFSSDNLQGECEWVLQSKVARIRILDPDDFTHSILTNDMEECLVHELLHLHFAPFDNEKNYMVQEQAIEAIAKALVETDRLNSKIK